MSERHRTISGREAMRCGTMVAASASVVAPIDSAQSETAEYAELRAAQGAANSKPGPRTVPAKVITAPGGLDPATAALVAAPYSPLWNLTAPDDAGWRAIVKKASDAALPTLATARAALAVTVNQGRRCQCIHLDPKGDPGGAHEPTYGQPSRGRLDFWCG